MKENGLLILGLVILGAFFLIPRAQTVVSTAPRPGSATDWMSGIGIGLGGVSSLIHSLSGGSTNPIDTTNGNYGNNNGYSPTDTSGFIDPWATDPGGTSYGGTGSSDTTYLT